MNKKFVQLLILAIIVMAIFGLWYKYLKSTNNKNGLFQKIDDVFQAVIQSQKHQVKVTPTPTINPYGYVLPAGVQVYRFSHGAKVVGPKIQTAIIDPLTPKSGDKQTVTITIKHNSPVTTATGILYTDNKQVAYQFKLIKGSASDGTWQSSWTASDTYDRIYHLNFLLKSSTGNWSGALTFR